MRAVLDTNVFVSYLLSSRDRQTTVNAVVDAACAYDLLLADGLLEELIGSVEKKRRLSHAIDLDDARDFAAAIRSFGELLPSPTPSSPPVTRDANDDYVYLSAIQFAADLLVSMDRALLVLAPVSAPLRILAPSEFMRLLRASRLVQGAPIKYSQTSGYARFQVRSPREVWTFTTPATRTLGLLDF